MVVYQPDRRRRVVLVLLVLTALALISFDERGSGTIDTARSTAADVIQPVRDASSDAFNPVTDWLDGLGRASELQSENQRLRRELAQAKTEAAAGAAARARVKELEDLFDLPQVEDYDGVVANVTGQGSGFDRTFSIDKGSNDGIAKDMPVVVGGALVGKVFRVTRGSAIVQRIDDRQFGVGAQIVEKIGVRAARARARSGRQHQPRVLAVRRRVARRHDQEGFGRDHARRPRRGVPARAADRHRRARRHRGRFGRARRRAAPDRRPRQPRRREGAPLQRRRSRRREPAMMQP